MAFDRMDWHYGGDYPSDLPNENGGTHIGFYLTWIIHNNLVGEFHTEESGEELALVKARKLDGREFLMTMCDEKFIDEDLSDEGNAFTQFYYAAEEKGYFDDYERVLKGHLPTTYHIENSWENYDKIAPVISEAYAKWKQAQG